MKSGQRTLASIVLLGKTADGNVLAVGRGGNVGELDTFGEAITGLESRHFEDVCVIGSKVLEKLVNVVVNGVVREAAETIFKAQRQEWDIWNNRLGPQQRGAELRDFFGGVTGIREGQLASAGP